MTQKTSLNRRSFLGLGAMTALGSITGVFGAARAFAGEGQAPVLVELFTSQGCSSCPMADALMSELVKRGDVIGLSYNVDYWDYIGWRDTLALPGNAVRQKDYVNALGLTNPYTPQMVIDGTVDVAGSRKAQVLAQIDKRLAGRKARISLPLSLTREGAEVKIDVGGAAGGTGSPAAVWVARIVRSQSVTIGGGENRGRAITYSHVVRSLTAVSRWTGTPLSLKLPARDPAVVSDAAVVWVQSGGMGEVLAAAQIDTR